MLCMVCRNKIISYTIQNDTPITNIDESTSIYSIKTGSGECFNVTITTKLYGHENAWSLGTCVSDDGRYRENNVYTEECCLDAGKYTLNCDDTYKDGWHGGFIEIQGTQYCEDFTEGHQQSQDIDIVYPGNHDMLRVTSLDGLK